jgi:hypothetical protein
MKPKKIPKPTAKDKAWQKKVEEQVKIEKVELDPKGTEQFDHAVKHIN